MRVKIFQITTFLLFIVASLRVDAQDKGFFNFKQLNYAQIDSLEKTQSSNEKKLFYKIDISPDYFPDATRFKLAQPRVFSRPAKNNFISSQVQYFYSEADSIVRLIDYTWDTKNSITSINDLRKEDNNQTGKLDQYSSEFWIIAKELNKVLGDPFQGTGKLQKMEEAGSEPWFQRQLVWEKNKTQVELNLIWSERGGALGTYRVRAKVYWVEK